MTVAELYRQIEDGWFPSDDFDTVEALNDGLLICTVDGQEFWLTAREQSP